MLTIFNGLFYGQQKKFQIFFFNLYGSMPTKLYAYEVICLKMGLNKIEYGFVYILSGQVYCKLWIGLGTWKCSLSRVPLKGVRLHWSEHFSRVSRQNKPRLLEPASLRRSSTLPTKTLTDLLRTLKKRRPEDLGS